MSTVPDSTVKARWLPPPLMVTPPAPSMATLASIGGRPEARPMVPVPPIPKSMLSTPTVWFACRIAQRSVPALPSSAVLVTVKVAASAGEGAASAKPVSAVPASASSRSRRCRRRAPTSDVTAVPMLLRSFMTDPPLGERPLAAAARRQ